MEESKIDWIEWFFQDSFECTCEEDCEIVEIDLKNIDVVISKAKAEGKDLCSILYCFWKKSLHYQHNLDEQNFYRLWLKEHWRQFRDFYNFGSEAVTDESKKLFLGWLEKKIRFLCQQEKGICCAV